MLVRKAKQTKEATIPWGWVEPSVWTDRMLNALVTGVKGGKWFSLIDKVYKETNLKSAFDAVRRNKGKAGVDNVTLRQYESNLEHNLSKQSRELKSGSYAPSPILRRYIDKSSSRDKRPLGIPAVRDRVVQKALCNVVEPIFENIFAEDSYGFRPGRSCKDALRQVEAELRAGKMYIVDADLKSFFDTINHEILMDLVEEQISDGQVLDLIEIFLKHEVQDDLKCWKPEAGTPQGAVISPLLANVYLNKLDWLIPDDGVRMIRYADDFVIMCETKEKAEAALRKVGAWCDKMKLTLHPDKTHIVDMTEKLAGFTFLGYLFKRTKRTNKIIKVPKPESMKKLRDKIRPLTKRCCGICMHALISKLNPILRGWYEYYKHVHIAVLKDVDGWVRMRLRSILRKRAKRKGRGRGKDHQRYRNIFFRNHGLFSLVIAHDEEIQSLRC